MPLVDMAGTLASFRVHRRRWAARRRATPVAQLVVGSDARVEGTVAPRAGALTSPFARRECALWATRLDKMHLVVTHGKVIDRTHEEWTEIFRDASSEPIVVVDDAGGRVELDLATPFFPVVDLARVRHDPKDADGSALATYLWRHRVSPPSFISLAKDMAFYEATIPVGARVVAFGIVGEELGVSQDGYRDAPSRRLVLRGTTRAPLILWPVA